jgi:hypothetical protein
MEIRYQGVTITSGAVYNFTLLKLQGTEAH